MHLYAGYNLTLDVFHTLRDLCQMWESEREILRSAEASLRPLPVLRRVVYFLNGFCLQTCLHTAPRLFLVLTPLFTLLSVQMSAGRAAADARHSPLTVTGRERSGVKWAERDGTR